MSDQQTIDWLRGLAEKGGKGVVNNIDARCLGRVAGDLERMQGALRRISNGGTSVLISAALDECPINPEVLEQIVKDAVAGLSDDVGHVQVSGGDK